MTGTGSIVSWIFISTSTVMTKMEKLFVHKLFYYLSMLVNSINIITLVIIFLMGKNNYFEIYPQYMREEKRDDKFKIKEVL